MKKICQMIQSICFRRSGLQILGQVSEKTVNNFIQRNRIFSSKCVCSRKAPLFVHCRAFSTVNNDSTFSNPVSTNNDENNNKNDVIYYGSLTGSVKGIKVFTCISSLGGLVLQPILLQHVLKGENLAIGIALCTTVGFFTFVTPLLIHLFTRKYVTEIRYTPETDTYTATTLSFFLRRINIDFKVEDVCAGGAFPIFSTMSIKGRHVFIVSECFLDISHYVRIMGYDKPLDLKISTEEASEKKFVDDSQDSLNAKKL